MEHLEVKCIIEFLDRMVGDIHAHGETNHDNLAYDNLMAFDEVLDSMVDEIVDEAKKCHSPYYSEKRSGEYALNMLINIHEYIEDTLSSLQESHEKKEQEQIQDINEVYVSVYYSFENSAPLYKFKTKKGANDFIKKQYKEMLNRSQNDDYADVGTSHYEDGFAQIVFDNDTSDTIEWNICQVMKPKEGGMENVSK